MWVGVENGVFAVILATSDCQRSPFPPLNLYLIFFSVASPIPGSDRAAADEKNVGARGLTLSDVTLVDAALGRSLEAVAALAEEVELAKVRTDSLYLNLDPAINAECPYLQREAGVLMIMLACLSEKRGLMNGTKRRGYSALPSRYNVNALICVILMSPDVDRS